jgi:fatty-acyl-CoA synthase
MTVLWDALAEPGARSLRCWAGRSFEEATWAEVSADAARMTAGLRSAGVGPGERVATVLTNTPAAVRGILGTWLAGGTLASLPLPARGMNLAEYAGQIQLLCERIEPAALLVDAELIELIPARTRDQTRVRSWESMLDTGRIAASPPGQDEVAFIQYSSGSTTTPKGSMLTTRAIQAQIEIISSMIGLVPGVDRAVSWLPLSHDMGMFGCLLTPWVVDLDLTLSTPERFTMAPGTWFADCASFGATVTCGTNTALALATRRLRSRPLPGPLDLHTIILGAERLDWETLERAGEALAPYGAGPEVFMPAYGMAEAALAITSTPRADRPRSLPIDPVALADGTVVEVAPDAPAVTRIVASGVTCPGVSLSGLAEDVVSEIRVRSPSLALGYYADPERSAERFVDDELLTRDLGFVRDGYLYPVGRVDDLISIGGRKVYACEIESAVDALAEVRRGCSTLIETYEGGTARLTLLMELSQHAADLPALAERAAALAMSKAAVALDACVFLPRGAVPKTPSGKIQRYRCREMLGAGRFEPVRTVEFG